MISDWNSPILGLSTDAQRTRHCLCGRSCGLLLYGSSTAVTRRLQMVLNAAARFVVGIGKYEHITPVLRDNSPLAASGHENTVQDCCSDIWLCPRRWSRLFQASCPSSLWSVMLITPFCQPGRLVHFTSVGQRSFSVAPPVVWNALPLEVRSTQQDRTSTRPTLTAHQSPTVPIQAENSSVPTSLQHFMIPLRTIRWRVKLCHIKRDYAVHIIRAKCPKRVQTFA